MTAALPRRSRAQCEGEGGPGSAGIMASRRALLGIGALVASSVTWMGMQAPAAARCLGPVISFSPEVVGRGQSVSVTGGGFGDECYDTGAPPGATGILGEPIEVVDLVLLQGDREFVVGHADADDQYAFTVTVVVPASLEPGSAQVVARLAEGDVPAYDDGPQTLTVTDAPPVGASTGEASPSASAIEATGSSSSDQGIGKIGLLGTVGLALAAIYGIAVMHRRRERNQPA